MTDIHRIAELSAYGLITLLFCNPEVAAQPTRLAWRFDAGDRFRVEVAHSGDHRLEIGSDKLDSKLEVRSRLSWDVVKVEGNEFQIVLTVQSTAVKSRQPNGDLVQYDSDAKAELTPSEHQLRETVKPLTGLQVKLTMIPQGISQLVIDQEARAAMETNPAVHSVLAAIPEFPFGEVTVGHSWQRTRSRPSEDADFEGETFTYKGSATFEGKPVELIVSRMGSMDREDADGREIGHRPSKFHSIVGTRFDAKEGVLLTSKIRQHATVELEYEGRTAIQTMDNTTTVRFTRE